MEKEKYESLVSRILKLQKLAEQGEGGEAQNARMAIEAIVNRYGLSLDEILNDNQEKMYKWTVKTAREKQLWLQCLGVVLNTWQPPCYQEKGNSYALLAKLTKLQYAEMSDMYAFHKANMDSWWFIPSSSSRSSLTRSSLHFLTSMRNALSLLFMMGRVRVRTFSCFSSICSEVLLYWNLIAIFSQFPRAQKGRFSLCPQ